MSTLAHGPKHFLLGTWGGGRARSLYATPPPLPPQEPVYIRKRGTMNIGGSTGTVA